MSVANHHFASPPRPSAGASRHLHQSPAHLAALLDQSTSISQTLQLHAHILRHNHHHNPVLTLKLLRSYSSLGLLSHSLTLFNHTHDPNVFLWTSILDAHSARGHCAEAFGLYVRMLAQGVEPNAFTFSSLLKCCCLGSVDSVHSQVLKSGLGSDSYVTTGLLDVYAKIGDVESARKVFDKMPERSLVSLTAMISCYAKSGSLDEAKSMFDEMGDSKDVVCWNVMVDGFAQHGRPYHALELFREMLEEGVRADEVTVVSVLTACGQVGALETGRWIHSYVESNMILFNVRVGTALVDMYSKCGSLEDARAVFDKIVKKDVVAWNSMISGYAMHGCSQEAFSLFSRMRRMGVRPSDITFIGILTACSHAGLVDEGWRYFNSMTAEFEIEPKIQHYGCMVSLLGRAGRVKEAFDLVKNMTLEPDPVIWGALLEACLLHKNVRLGEEIAQLLIDRNSAHSGTYALLSNLYAAAGEWDGVARVRAKMKDSGIQKEPGCSSIEVNNRVHEFLAGDRRHPRSKAIYIMLEEISKWVKSSGHRPVIESVLHQMDDLEKERSLEVHSEKLALAFGLIGTPAGTPIRIVKNLRVCADCHDVMKLASKMTERKIVMRDRNRFHHFVNGCCSCGDYW
uniref:DYW domain-containing protein n=1 Tax=Kalanchoe fedtschenkoi TaxID=63787 RepID=A0A7N0V8L4_KALFE